MNGGIKTRCLTTWRRPIFLYFRLSELSYLDSLLIYPYALKPKVTSSSRKAKDQVKALYLWFPITFVTHTFAKGDHLLG